VVYTVANEGSRLEIPEGPLGRLISGLCNLFITWFKAPLFLLKKKMYQAYISIIIQVPFNLTGYLIFMRRVLGRTEWATKLWGDPISLGGHRVLNVLMQWLSFVHIELWVELSYCIIGCCCKIIWILFYVIRTCFSSCFAAKTYLMWGDGEKEAIADFYPSHCTKNLWANMLLQGFIDLQDPLKKQVLQL
jgi:hypothetical protein